MHASAGEGLYTSRPKFAAPSARHHTCRAKRKLIRLQANLRSTRLCAAAQELHAQQPPLDSLPDARVSTITPASRRLLEHVGAWQHCGPAAAAFADMQARMQSPNPQPALPTCYTSF